MPSVFPVSQHPMIKAVLNRLVPAGAGFPGAGDLDLIELLDRAASAHASTRRMFVEGMRQISVESARRHGKSFQDLPAAEQDGLLRYVEGQQRAFFEALVSHVYTSYYSHATVIELLGLEVRAPQPLGHALPPFDPTITRAMSERRPFYRRT